MLSDLRRQLEKARAECRRLADAIYAEENKPKATFDSVRECPQCKDHSDVVDKIIYHNNGHVWPGFAGEPY